MSMEYVRGLQMRRTTLEGEIKFTQKMIIDTGKNQKKMSEYFTQISV